MVSYIELCLLSNLVTISTFKLIHLFSLVYSGILITKGRTAVLKDLEGKELVPFYLFLQHFKF